MVIGKNSGRFIAGFQIGECHLHGIDKERVDIRVLRKQNKICPKVFGFGLLLRREDHRIQCARDIHCVNGREDRTHRRPQPVDKSSVARDTGGVDSQHPVAGQVRSANLEELARSLSVAKWEPTIRLAGALSLIAVGVVFVLRAAFKLM